MDPAISLRPQPGNITEEDQFETGLWWQQLLTKQLQYLMDVTLLLAAFFLAYLLRFDFAIPPKYFYQALLQAPCVILFQFVALNVFGVYNFIWRFVGLAELKAFLKAALLSTVPLLALRVFLPDSFQQFRIPLSVTLMDICLALVGVIGLRVLRRMLYERYEKQANERQVWAAGVSIEPTRALLVGGGKAGVATAKVILARQVTKIQVMGFVDDDVRKRGAIIQGIKVLGNTRELPALVAQHKINHIIITIALATRADFRRILDICTKLPVKVQVIPGLSEILQGRVQVSRIRDVEIEDLLGREPVRLDEESMRELLTGKTVLISGAGGSIGSELARQVPHFQPTKVLLVERSEFALFNIERELRQRWPELEIVPLLADVGDERRMRCIFSSHRPQVLLHAAAHKHVPMMESNATEAVKNNILATHLLGSLAGKFGVEVFVLISTDKAVRSTSVMGASKRVAELVIQDLNKRYETAFVAVRFGNVIGSAGSVIPIFREQIRRGGPVTVTHPDMVRYFMTIPEAAQLVIQAAAMGEGGEILILDMGEPIRILDLAKETIRLSGLAPYDEVEIVFTGIRPGEKLFEELELTEEEMSKTRHPKIFIGKIATYSDEVISHALKELTDLVEKGEDQELRRFLVKLLPESQLNLTAVRMGLPLLPQTSNAAQRGTLVTVIDSV